MTSPPLPPATPIHAATCAASMLRIGFRNLRCFSIAHAETGFSITWCGTWWERFSRWDEEISARQIFLRFSKPVTASEQGRPHRREGCSWSTWTTSIIDRQGGCYSEESGMPGALTHSAFSRIGQLASLPRVHAAFQWFHLQERRMMQWQQELVSIAAPPFGERRRAEWLAERFRELKLQQVEIDREGNVLGWYPGDSSRASKECVMLSAHIDTVFPIGTPIAPVL